jgi:hypothetical protein
MDHSHSIMPPLNGEGEEAPFMPGAELTVVQSKPMKVRRKRRGLDAIGSGSKITQAMSDSAFGRFDGDPDVMAAHRGLLATEIA